MTATTKCKFLRYNLSNDNMKKDCILQAVMCRKSYGYQTRYNRQRVIPTEIQHLTFQGHSHFKTLHIMHGCPHFRI